VSERPDLLLALRGWSLTRETAAGPVTLLRDLDLTLRRGEWIALAGANGSGKTSLLRWLAGEGSPLRVRCGLVFQDPGEPLVGATVAEELVLGRPGLDPAPRLREFGLDGAAGLDPRVLSAGEQQRLGLAVAEAGGPELLLCDEPAALQDEAHARWLWERLRAWRERTGGAVVYATQRRAEALLADRLVVLAGGRIVADGPPASLVERAPARDLLAPPFPDLEATDVLPRGRAGAAPVVATWDNVSCRWPEGARGFAGVTLRLCAGDRIGITGASGAGKSTLLACAAGLRAPDTGCCRLAGRALCARGAPDLEHGQALLAPQFPEHLFTRTSVAAEIALDPALAASGVDGVLAAAGLAPALAGRNPHDLSSGERRRLAVALVGLSGRPLLLFDEPTAGLDRGGARGVARLLRAAPTNAAVVVASHDDAFLVACGCRIFALGPAGLQARA
jgi:energy-coupling factor transport system ATP-binding protein